MSMINIRETSDTFERYKMPKLVAKIEGKGNGIKTVIVNMVDISRALKRPPLYPTKFFGCELGAQIQVDSKNQRYIVNGAHTAERLQELLFSFIKKYVLCAGCGNPETNLAIKKNSILSSCIACGYSGPIESVSRFSSYLIKHPPDQTDSPAATKKEKKDKKKKEQNGNGPGFHSQESGEHGSNDDDDDDDDDWLEETEEDRRQREADLSAHVRSMIISNDAEKPEDERLDIFYAFCKDLARSGPLIHHARGILERADALAVKEKAPLLLMDLLVGLKTFQKDIQDNTDFLRMFTFENTRAQRNLLGGVEKLVSPLKEAEINQMVPPLLQILYMQDIVEEKGFNDWSRKSSSRYVGSEVSRTIHAAAAPFMQWLKEAEEEESDEDEEEEMSPEPEEPESDLHVDFSNSGKVGVVEVIKPAAEEQKKDQLEDLDIDNI